MTSAASPLVTPATDHKVNRPSFFCHAISAISGVFSQKKRSMDAPEERLTGARSI
jgi:hypothetical protein